MCHLQWPNLISNFKVKVYAVVDWSQLCQEPIINSQEFCKLVVKLFTAWNTPWWLYLPQKSVTTTNWDLYFFLLGEPIYQPATEFQVCVSYNTWKEMGTLQRSWFFSFQSEFSSYLNDLSTYSKTMAEY